MYPTTFGIYALNILAKCLGQLNPAAGRGGWRAEPVPHSAARHLAPSIMILGVEMEVSHTRGDVTGAGEGYP